MPYNEVYSGLSVVPGLGNKTRPLPARDDKTAWRKRVQTEEGGRGLTICGSLLGILVFGMGNGPFPMTGPQGMSESSKLSYSQRALTALTLSTLESKRATLKGRNPPESTLERWEMPVSHQVMGQHGLQF